MKIIRIPRGAVVAIIMATLTVMGVTGCSGAGFGFTSSVTPIATTPAPVTTAGPAADSPPDNGKAGVEDSDGALRTLPLVDQVGNAAASADTTGDPRSPATLKCATTPVNWAGLVDCVGSDHQWYIQGVNARKGKTGFGWSDIQKWARDGAQFDTRVIQVYNWPGLSNIEARAKAAGFIGKEAAASLPIARHDCIVNTRGLGRGKMQDFTDCRKMVRVSLAPLVYERGKIVGMRSDAGVFVDCLNDWWIPRQVIKHGKPPASKPPASKPPASKPPASKPPTLAPKKTSEHPAVKGNGPSVPWKPAPAPSTPASTPGGGTPPETYTPSPPPSPTPTPRSTSTTSAPPPPPPPPLPSPTATIAPPPPTGCDPANPLCDG